MFEPLMRTGAAPRKAAYDGRERRLGVGHKGEPRNFEEFIYKVWGTGIAKHFAIPYNRKLWAVPLDEMETSWLGGRVPLPNLEEMVARRALTGPQADGTQRPVRLSAARRFSGPHGRVPASPEG